VFLPVAFVQLPAQSGDQFAISIAAGRDLNGDCTPDLVIGDGTPLDGADVWFVSGRDGSVLARHESRGGPSTVSVDLVGDIDGDGSSEVAISVIHASVRPGSAEIVSGRTGTTLWKVRGEDFGLRECDVRAAGNVDEDGCPDLIVVGSRVIEPYHTAATVLVVSSRKASVIWGVDSEPLRGIKYLGMRLATTAAVGDVDGDDRDDIAISWENHRPRSGRVVLYSGRTGLLLREFSGTEAEVDFGYGLDGGIDFDGDLRPDILVGSPGLSRVRVYSGRDGSLLRSIEGTDLRGGDESKGDAFGECVRFLRDTSGDGVPEILVGAPLDTLFLGAAMVCSGRSNLIQFEIEGGQDCYAGRALAAAGDIDRDGIEDFAVGSVPNGRSQSGLVRVFSGKSGRLLLRIDRNWLMRAKRPASTPR
jgi:hypothetical protein